MDALDFLGDDAPIVDAESSEDEAPALPQAPSALALSLARLRQHFDRNAALQLEKQGFVVLDNVFEHTLVNRFADEISKLHAGGHTALNSTAFVAEHSEGELPSIARLIPKPNVFETELTAEVRGRLQHEMPELCALHAALPGVEAQMASLCPSLQLSVGEQRSSLKLQYNAGARACFPFHFDSPGGQKDSRRLTMLLYLNRDWQESDGGQLLLQPFLTPSVRVAPKAGRMVVFKSDSLLHRVLPSTSERRCLTIWLHRKALKAEEKVAADAQSAARATSDAQALKTATATAGNEDVAAADAAEDAFASLWMHRLADPVWQRVLARVVYLEPWRESFLEAHGRADAQADQQASLAANNAAERVSYVTGGAAPAAQQAAAAAAASTCYIDADAAAAAARVHVRGAEPLVASLEADADRLRQELAGTGILELLAQTVKEQQGRTIDV